MAFLQVLISLLIFLFLSISLLDGKHYKMFAVVFFAVLEIGLVNKIFQEIDRLGRHEVWHWVIILGCLVFSFFWGVFSVKTKESKSESRPEKLSQVEELPPIEEKDCFDESNPTCMGAKWTPAEQPLPAGCNYPSCYNCSLVGKE